MYKKQLLKLFFCSLFLLLSSWAMAQKITVTGKVTDEKGQELPAPFHLLEAGLSSPASSSCLFPQSRQVTGGVGRVREA